VEEKGKPKGSRLVDAIVEGRWKTIEAILFAAYLEREGVLEITPRPVFDDVAIIHTLAQMIWHLEAKIRPKKNLTSEGRKMLKEAYEEIEDIWSAVKRVGFSGRIVDPEPKWKAAALKRFDKSTGFRFLERRYLDDNELYRFTEGQEKRDFIGKLASKILRDSQVGDYGAQYLYKLWRKLTKEYLVTAATS
jgi:hypothetical protein